MSIHIREESPQDIEAIHRVTEAAFKNAPHTDHTEQFIVSALRKAGQLSVSLVAEYAGEVIGHVAVSPVTISDGTGRWYGLGPISVLPDHQGQGVGSRLMERALADLRALGAAGCVVLGDPGYYARFGFRVEPGLTYPDVPPEYFQALVFHGAVPSGTVAYHESFAAQS
jgi:putative acetyltransferase